MADCTTTTALLILFISILNIYPIQGKRYVIHFDKVNWYQANVNCRAKGDHLATVFNQREHDNLIRLLQSQAPNEGYFWISLNDLGRDGKYVWFATGKELGQDYRNWAPGEPLNRPGEKCVAIMKTGTDSQGLGTWQWNDDMCRTMQTGYICDTETPA